MMDDANRELATTTPPAAEIRRGAELQPANAIVGLDGRPATTGRN